MSPSLYNLINQNMNKPEKVPKNNFWIRKSLSIASIIIYVYCYVESEIIIDSGSIQLSELLLDM